MANTKYDLDAGVIGYDADHQRKTAADAVTIAQEGEQFTEAHRMGDGEETRRLNDDANRIRQENNHEDYVTGLPEELDGTPREVVRMSDVRNVNDEALRAIAKYSEYGNLSPYEEGQNEELDKSLAEQMGKYAEAREACDFDGMRTAGATMNDLKAACGFESMSYAEDIATVRAGEGATPDKIAKLMNIELVQEVDQAHDRIAGVTGLKSFDEYEPGTNPEMDAQLKVWGDAWNTGKDLYQVDMMRMANDEANKIRLENGYMPNIAYATIGVKQDSVGYVFSMAESFATEENARESGKYNEKQALPFDRGDQVDAVLAAQRAEIKSAPTISYEQKVQDADALESAINGGEDLSQDLGQSFS